MKIRKGFVSNSSSSSFVVAVGKEAKVTLTIEADLARFANEIIVTMDDLERYMLDEWGWGSCNTLDLILADSDYARRVYEESKVAIEAGKWVLFGSFSSDGEVLEQLLCEWGVPESPGIDVIESQGGY
jgi:hypothetical protein